MARRIVTLAAFLVGSVIALAVAHEETPAQVAAAAAASQPQTYQLQMIPGTTGQWVVLDTRSGDVQHWARVQNEYIVTTLRRGKIPSYGWEREVLRPPSDTGR